MKTMTLASQILQRHDSILNTHRIIFAGDIQDNFAAQHLNAKVLTSQYHHHKRLSNANVNSSFGSEFTKDDIKGFSLLVYYWPKTKDEAIFQLTQLLSLISQDVEILIVGENRIGVRSVENRFSDILSLQKIDTAKRCSLYYAKIKHRVDFNLEKFWVKYPMTDKIHHYALPGVFSRQHLDPGSDLLIQSFKRTSHSLSNTAKPLFSNSHPLNFLKQPKMSADILDLCAGAGVITLALHKDYPNVNWTLADSQAQAIQSAAYNLNRINQKAAIIASDFFSEVEGKFDMIISNPPFHDGKQTDYGLAERLIKEAPKFLRPEGALRIVANGFLPYEDIMQSVFKNVEILEKNTKFTVYQSIKSAK